MSINNASLKQKAQAFVAAIATMSDNAKERHPGSDYGSDYNMLRKLTAEINPHLVPVLPPEARIIRLAGSGQWSSASYIEIATYCQQIVNLLP